MFEGIPIIDKRKQAAAGIFMLMMLCWGVIKTAIEFGREMSRVCGIIEQAGDHCAGGGEIIMLSGLALIGCFFLGYAAYRYFALFLIKPKR